MAPKVKWDEANLEENEAIKAEINPTKIDEPKTPYHRPLSDDGDDPLDDDVSQARMASLDLEPADSALADHIRRRASEMEATTSGTEERARSATPTWSGGSSAPGSHGRQPSDEVSSGDEDARKEKRRRFEEHRRSHYQMKQALQRAKELLASNGEVEPGDQHQHLRQATSNGRLSGPS